MAQDGTVLVTGAAGFLGSHVTDCLVRNGRRVVALDDLSGGFRENVNASALFVEGSVVDAELVKRLFDGHGFEHVFHLAAYAAEGLSHFIRRYNYETNLIGSVNLINASVNHGVRCMVFTSSIAVYGRNQTPMSEELTPRPEDPYGISKYAVELDLAAAREMFGLNHVVFRPHNVYGERQHIGDRYRNVVGIFMNRVMRGEPLPVFGDGEQTRAFSYVGDVAPVIAGCVERPATWNQVYNIGSDQPCSVNELGRAVCRVMGVEFNPQYLPARHEVKHAWASHEKVARVFGCTARCGLEEGLARMAHWAREAGCRAGQVFDVLEIERGLPASWKNV